MSVSLRENEISTPPANARLLTKTELDRPNFNQKRSNSLFHSYFSRGYGVQWITLDPKTATKMTYQLVQALREEQVEIERRIRTDLGRGDRNGIQYQVLASAHPTIFNLGGDLEYVAKLIRARNRDALVEFGQLCVDLIYTNATNYSCPVTTIALVQGAALGGGFEAALSANVLIAERQSTMGLPEVVFNMFPGMGAYQLLAQRLPPVQAQRLIQSGRTYSAEELHAMGLVDILVDTGKGEQAVWDYVRRHGKQSKGEWALRRTMLSSSPIHYEELLESVEIWADNALSLDTVDLRHMDFLVRAQRSRKINI